MAPNETIPVLKAPPISPNVSQPMQTQALLLPVQIYTPGDIARLGRELESVESFFMDAKVKAVTIKSVPQASSQLNALISVNGLNLLHQDDRSKLITFLKHISTKAPTVHMSFATDPKPEFLMKIVDWFRSNAHPHTMLRVGLQPNIAAGCVLRTTNKYFDLSFKEHFRVSKEKLAIALRMPA